MIKNTVFLFCFLLVGSSAWTQEDSSFSGQITEESGLTQTTPSSLQPYQYSRLLLQSRGDLNPEFSWSLEGEAAQQFSGMAQSPAWLTYTSQNIVNLEIDNSTAFDNQSYQMARFDRAFVKWTSGRWEITGGLQAFDGGTSYFYRPTDYFNPLPPLAWITDETLGSEGLNVDCFLLDDLSVESSVRWLVDETSEEIIRLINKGIGISITPSFAWMEGRNGAGLDLSGTFPDFQIRLEGVNWFYPDSSSRQEWITGLSTLVQGTKLTLEGLRDATGEALGGWALTNPDSFYLFASAQKDFSGQWQAAPALLKSLDGGPLLLWPKFFFKLDQNWKLSAQAQWLLGSVQGPLGLIPSQTGFSLAYLF